MRDILVSANWKLHKTLDEARSFVARFGELFRPEPPVRVLLFPSYPFLAAVAELAKDCGIEVGAQSSYQETQGAFTGGVSAPQIASTGAGWVLVGHSERRQVFGEGDAIFQRRIQAALAAGLKVMLCVGETLEEREAELTFDVVRLQVKRSLAGFAEADLDGRLALAYEPVWAIGTGRTATDEQAQEAHAVIRTVLGERFSEAFAGRTSILYGGSVKPKNAAGIMGQADVDGVLVGGASLDPESFAEIAKAAPGA